MKKKSPRLKPYLKACFECKEKNDIGFLTDGVGKVEIICDSCGNRGPICPTKQQAIKSWNK